MSILHDIHQGDSHFSTNCLASEGNSWWQSHEELLVKQTPQGIRLLRFSEGKKSRQFELSQEEFAALLVARQSFFDGIEAYKAAEQARIASEIAQARELVAMVCRGHALSWELREQDERFSLVDSARETVLMYPSTPPYVLTNVKAILTQKGLIDPDPGPDAGDGFDPFLDSDDLA